MTLLTRNKEKSPLPGTSATYNVNMGSETDPGAREVFNAVGSSTTDEDRAREHVEQVLGSVHISKPSIEHVFFLLRPLLRPLLEQFDIEKRMLHDLINIIKLEHTFLDKPVSISANVAYEVNYQSRKFLFLYSGQPVILSISGGGSISAAPNVWIPLSFPTGTKLTAPNVTDGSPVGVTIRACDVPMSMFVEEIGGGAGVQGWIAATGIGTAAQDDPLTFPAQVRKVVLYNAAAVAVPLEFDVVSTATSFPIQPGQFMVFDEVFCSVIHVFPSATLPINTTAGLYVKGWR